MGGLLLAIVVSLAVSPQADVSFEQKLLVKGVPAAGGGGGWGIETSPDGRSGVVVGMEAWWGEKKLLTVPVDPVRFLADGRPVLRGMAPGGTGFVVSVGDETGPAYAFVPAVVLSGNRKTFAYLASPGKDQVGAVIDGTLGELHPDAKDLVLSPDGKRWAMVVRGTDRALPFHVVIDGAKGPAVRSVSRLAFGPDGASVGYLWADDRDRKTAVIDGESHGPVAQLDFALGAQGAGPVIWGFDQGKAWIQWGGRRREHPRIEKVAVGVDGGSVAYVVVSEKESRVWIGDQEGPPYAEIGDLRTSADGKRVVYAAKEPSGRWLVVDGAKAESSRFGLRIDKLEVAPGGGGYGYLGVTLKEPATLVLNGAKLPADTLPSWPFVISANGKAAAYAGRSKSRLVVFHAGKPGPELPEAPTSLILGADGKTLAYQTGNTGLVVNHALVKEMDPKDAPAWKGRPVVSPDGKKVAFPTLRQPSGLWWRVVDAK